ncbi:MAG: PilZ domain-containing protein [Syntrophobacteraceae bacterium]
MSEQEGLKEAGGERKLHCQVVFETEGKTFSGTSVHFNERGILVMCKNPARLNAKGKLLLRFQGFNNPVELTGEVVWANIYGAGDSLSPRGMGIKFTGVDRETERMLSEFSAHDALANVYACYYT